MLLAIIYRPDAQKACEILSRAVAFINEHKEELQVNMEDYSLWGGSAGGRMTDWVGTYEQHILEKKNIQNQTSNTYYTIYWASRRNRK